MIITVDEAREYFSHPSQQKASRITPDTLPEHGVTYMAHGGVCCIFHAAHWPGVVMVHHAVKPEVWGHAVAPAKAIIREFQGRFQPVKIIGWTEESNRAALAFARRVGFREFGRLDLPDGAVIMQEYE